MLNRRGQRGFCGVESRKMAREREKMGDADWCPSKATLEAFVVGDVAADEIKYLAEHLKSFKKCESGLQALDVYYEDLLAQLGTMPECSHDPAETLPADLRAAAESAYEEVHGGRVATVRSMPGMSEPPRGAKRFRGNWPGRCNLFSIWKGIRMGPGDLQATKVRA